GAASPGAIPLQASLDGGFSYRAAGTAPLAARFRLRERPAGFRLPLSARLGTGADAVWVDLSRLSPLGKVAFDLSIPEISAGISAAMDRARTAADAPQRGELLADPAFARWQAVGDEIGPPRPFVLGTDADARFVAFAPDGRIAYVALAVAEALRFIAWDTETGTEAWHLDLALDSPRGLAVDPAGRAAYLLAGHRIAVIGLPERGHLLGPPLSVDDEDVLPDPAVIAASADGLRIAIAGRAAATGLTPPPDADLGAGEVDGARPPWRGAGDRGEAPRARTRRRRANRSRVLARGLAALRFELALRSGGAGACRALCLRR